MARKKEINRRSSEVALRIYLLDIAAAGCTYTSSRRSQTCGWQVESQGVPETGVPLSSTLPVVASRAVVDIQLHTCKTYLLVVDRSLASLHLDQLCSCAQHLRIPVKAEA